MPSTSGDQRSWPDDTVPTDETDTWVAIVRTAIILAVLLLPWTVPGLRETPRLLHIATIVAALYTLALYCAYLFKRPLPLQRHLAILCDIFLVTAAILAWPNQGKLLFQLYYIVVMVAAVWFGRNGATATAVLAIGAFIAAQYSAVGLAPAQWPVLGTVLLESGAPVLIILALATSTCFARETSNALADTRWTTSCAWPAPCRGRCCPPSCQPFPAMIWRCAWRRPNW